MNIEFDIHFRTFGDDYIEIVKEFNDFCEGNHMIYKTNDFREYKINEKAAFFRCKEGDYMILDII